VSDFHIVLSGRAPVSVQSPQEKFFGESLEAVDEMMKELETRFPVNDMEKIAALEQLVVNAALGKPYEMHEKAALEYLDEDVKSNDFLDEVSTLRSLNFRGKDFHGLVEFFASNMIKIEAFPEVVKAIKLLLTVPVSAATAERSFSVLRRIKSWDRASMGQEVLNFLGVLFVHKPQLDLDEVAKAFVMGEEGRRDILGKW